MFAPNQKFYTLQSIEQRLDAFAELGVEHAVVIPFDKAFAEQSPQNFLKKYLFNNCCPQKLIIGYDFRFGKGKQGSFSEISSYALEHQVESIQSTPLEYDGQVISSTWIRDVLQQHNLKLASQLLGRPYTFKGEVIKGFGRGRQIGFPTANLQAEQRVCVPDGVYAGYAKWDGDRYGCVVNIGKVPTFNNQERSVEAHILNFDEMIYGQNLEVEFVEFVRHERKFSGIEELSAQIQADIRNASAQMTSR